MARALRLLALALLIAALGGAAGCGKDKTTKPEPTPAPTPRLTPTSVVDSLVSAYRHRNIKAYAELLADDFQFWFDPATRPDNVPEFWTRLQDSTATDHLFNAPEVTDIRIQLTYGPDVPDPAIGHERWRKIRVTDTFLEIDKQPQVGEIITYRVDGDVQDFYVRQGHSPADTLAGSPTSKQWFLVEWHDLARLSALTALKTFGGAPAPAVQSTTWGSVKALYR
jgi:hypothetical protein